jgi:hypothetical protein
MSSNDRQVVLPPLKPSAVASLLAPSPDLGLPQQQQQQHHHHQHSPSHLSQRPNMSAPPRRCDISTLLSPPGKTSDSFGDGFGDGPGGVYGAQRMMPPMMVMTGGAGGGGPLPGARRPYYYAPGPDPLASSLSSSSSSGARILSPPTTPSQPDANSHSTAAAGGGGGGALSSHSLSSPLVDPILFPSSPSHDSHLYHHHSSSNLFDTPKSAVAAPRGSISSSSAIAALPATPRTTTTTTSVLGRHALHLIDRHMSARTPASPHATLPAGAEYELWLDFVQAFRVSSSAGGSYVPTLPHKNAAVAASSPSSPSAPPSRARAGGQRPDRVIKPSARAKASSASNHRAMLAAVASGGGTSSSPPPSRSSAARRSVDAPPASRRVVAPSREDKDFAALPDYSPPTRILDGLPGCFRVEWRGHAITLDSDPHRDRLHPEELVLASTLRLDCATYLTSKRRIFIRRIECARNGKEFRKTDAQQACKIDVNKASKLWTAYEKVGWLDKALFARWIAGSEPLYVPPPAPAPAQQ